jgi:hypothetical protein
VRRIFVDRDLEGAFEEAGFVQVPLLDQGRLQQLESAYPGHADPKKQKFDPLDIKDPELRRHVTASILDVVGARILTFFEDYRLVYGGFISKYRGRGSVIAPHTDPTIVDESRFVSVVVWIPLTDVKERNGCLRVVRGAHRMMPQLRAHPELPGAQTAGDLVERHPGLHESIEMPAGNALFFHPALPHWSGENRARKPRVAAQIYAVPREADVINCRMENGKVARYRVSDDSFAKAGGPDRERGELLDIVDYDLASGVRL